MLKRNFPSFIQAFLDYSKNVGAPHKFLLWSAISGVAAALERKTWIIHNGMQVIYPNFYIMLIADSGVARKSTSTRPIVDLISHVEGIRDMSAQLSAASLVEQLKKAGDAKTFEFENIKYKNSSIFSYSSEAKSLIGEKSGLDGVQALLTDLYDCGKINIWSDKIPAWSKETISGGKHDIFNPCLNMLACSTPAWLNECIGRSGIEGGFASRIIFVNEKEQHEDSLTGWIEDNGESLLTNKTEKFRQLLVEDLTAINKIQGRYRTATGWKQVHDQIQIDSSKKAREGGEAKAYFSRKLWHCMKLAQVLAADQSDSLILTPDHLASAKELLESLEPDMYSAFSMRGENKNLASFIFVWEIMRRKKVWKRDVLGNATFKHATPSQLDEHLRALKQMGKVDPIMTDGSIFYKVLDQAPLGEKAS